MGQFHPRGKHRQFVDLIVPVHELQETAIPVADYTDHVKVLQQMQMEDEVTGTYYQMNSVTSNAEQNFVDDEFVSTDEYDDDLYVYGCTSH